MISLKWFWGKFIQVSKSFIAMKGNVMINYFLYVVILVLVPGFLRHSKAFSHVEIIPGKELNCPREQWDHISLEPGLAMVSESLPGAKSNNGQGKTVFSIYYHARPEDELKGAIFTKKIQQGSTLEINMGIL